MSSSLPIISTESQVATVLNDRDLMGRVVDGIVDHAMKERRHHIELGISSEEEMRNLFWEVVANAESGFFDSRSFRPCIFFGSGDLIVIVNINQPGRSTLYKGDVTILSLANATLLKMTDRKGVDDAPTKEILWSLGNVLGEFIAVV